MKHLFFLLLLPVAFSLTSFTTPSSKSSAIIAENEGVIDLNFTHFNEHGTYTFMPYTLNVQRNWKMIGPGKLQNYMLRGRYKVTVTATGEVTAEHGGFDIECRG
jgi:hypothetical protein